MKKALSPFDDLWTSTLGEASSSDSTLHDAGGGGLMVDDGDPFPLAAQTVTTGATSASKPIASIATLADYLVNGFWQYNNTIAHHWASSTISFEPGFLALSQSAIRQARSYGPGGQRYGVLGMVSTTTPLLGKAFS